MLVLKARNPNSELESSVKVWKSDSDGTPCMYFAHIRFLVIFFCPSLDNYSSLSSSPSPLSICHHLTLISSIWSRVNVLMKTRSYDHITNLYKKKSSLKWGLSLSLSLSLRVCLCPSRSLTLCGLPMRMVVCSWKSAHKTISDNRKDWGCTCGLMVLKSANKERFCGPPYSLVRVGFGSCICGLLVLKN